MSVIFLQIAMKSFITIINLLISAVRSVIIWQYIRCTRNKFWNTDIHMYMYMWQYKWIYTNYFVCPIFFFISLRWQTFWIWRISKSPYDYWYSFIWKKILPRQKIVRTALYCVFAFFWCVKKWMILFYTALNAAFIIFFQSLEVIRYPDIKILGE